jgi:hypothetical protein
VSPFCPGKSGSPTVFSIDGQIGHTASLKPQDVTVLEDVSSVSSWAAQANLVVPGTLLTALGALSGVRFVGVRFNAPSGPSVTPALRVSMPGTPAMLPLALTSAASGGLRVSAWVIGQGESNLIGAVQVATSPKSLVWQAGAQSSNYDDLTGSSLASGSDTFLIEATNHEALSQNVSIAQGTAFIDGVVTTFFSRAAAYGDGSFDSAACIAAASPALESTSVVAAVCPHAEYGVIDSTATCTESPGPGQIDPSTLRCGIGADDLALALSGLTPGSTWLTRQTLIIPSDANGVDSLLGLVDGAAVSPVIQAYSVDVSDCGDGGAETGSSSSGSPTTSSSSSGGVGPATGSTGSSSMTSSGSGDGAGGDQSSGSGAGDVLGTAADVSDGCDGTSDGSCSGSSDGSSSDGSSGSCDSGSDSSGSSDSCSSGSSSSDSCSSGSGSSDSCSGGSSSDSCSGGSSGDSCSGGDAFKCETAGAHRVRGPRPSIVLMLAIAVAAPLRRRGRTNRRKPGSAKA